MAFDPAAAAKLLAAKQKVLITAHLNPDGDALGSMLAMAQLCLRLGKEPRLVNQSSLPEFLEWVELPGALAHSYAELSGWVPDLAVFLDCGTPARVGADGASLAAGKRLPGWENVKILNIDHHGDNPKFGDVNFVEPTAGATAELIGELAEYMGQPLSGQLGEALYLGLTSDSGNFTYSSSTPNLMAMAARIVAGGLKVEEFTAKSENNWSVGRMRLWGELMQNLRFAAGDKIVATLVTNAILKKYNCKAGDLEGFVSFLRHLKSAQVSLLVREKSSIGGSKISLRSMGGQNSVDVQQVAAQFGGGGHKSASGADVDLPPEEALQTLLAALKKVVV